MTDNEKLIEEARRAYLDAWAATNLEDVPPGTRSRNGIIAALAVFEKAHTPTDNEREARLEYVIDAAVPVSEFPSWRFRYSRRIADAVRAAGFRRSEPTDDERRHIDWALAYAQRYWQHGGEPESQRALSVLASVVRRSEVPGLSRTPGWSHPEAVYSPEVFTAIQGLLNEAQGSPMHALRLAVSRQRAESTAPLLDADGDAISSGEHRRVVMPDSDLPVCDTCTNVLGLNIRWDQSHPEPQGELSSEVPEPSVEGFEGILDRATLDEYLRVDPDETYERLVVKANALASTVRRLLATSVPQGEPSDAQVLAGLNAFYAPEGHPGRTLADWSEGSVRAMRAALRAAGDATRG